MTQERFHRLLDNPDLLAVISYEEMKTLALAYPYAHNLRYLLALKAAQDDHPDADRALSAAAAYSLDRRQLFHLTLLKTPVFQPMPVVVEEAVLELKPIETVQRELEALVPQPRAEITEQPAVQEVAAVPALVVSSGVETAQTPTTSKTQDAEPQGQPKLVLAQPFALWISRFNPPTLKSEPEPPIVDKTPVSLPEKTLSPGLSAQELAERSVTENKDVVSETLARLLAKQGYRDKAIVMYERLRLVFPEKSAYFAAEIEKLKK